MTRLLVAVVRIVWRTVDRAIFDPRWVPFCRLVLLFGALAAVAVVVSLTLARAG